MTGPRRVVLLGFMAAGKTTVGRRLAEKLGWRFVDVDQEVEREEGRSIPRIFEEDGEAAFRSMEAAAARAALAQDGVVVAPGGGWVTVPGALDGVPPGTLTVWLRVPAEEAVRRAEAGGSAGPRRPLLEGPDPRRRAAALLAEREPAYRKAQVWVETSGRTPEEVADEIARRLADAAPGG